MDIAAGLSGIALGAGFGFVLQRGRFCLNTAFRNLFYIRDYAIFRTYVLAAALAVLGAGLLEQAGLLDLDPVRQRVAWVANTLGGYLFGVGMVLAGGCGSGTWYKAGEGLLGSWMAAFGFMLGAASAGKGILAGIAGTLRGLASPAAGHSGIHDLLGVNRWVVIGILCALAAVFLAVKREGYSPAQVGYSWRTTGAAAGLIAVLALYISQRATGIASGLTFAAPSGRLLGVLAGGDAWEWGGFMVAGVPLGAFASAKGLHEFSWRAPGAATLVQQFCGGVLMGAGGVIAGGCAVGHGITGLAALSAASLVSMLFIALGSWTMIYFLFMRKPPEG